MKQFWVIILFICISAIATAQTTPQIKQLEVQRKAALKEIEITTKLLEEATKSAKNSLNRLNLLSSQILSRKKLINTLNQEVEEINLQIKRMNDEIAVLEKELGSKKEKYAHSLRGIYKRRTEQDKLLFILSSDNFAQSLRRIRYMREYSDWQKLQAAGISQKQKEINKKKEETKRVLSEKEQLLSQREDEHSKLQKEETNQKKETQELSKKQKNLQADLRKKKKQADDLNARIEKLIAEEIARAEAEARAAREKARAEGKEPEVVRKAESKGGYAMTKEEQKLSADFGSNKGKLPSPLNQSHTIVSRFGRQQHAELKNVVVFNNGIDIQTTPGADAQAVFNGVVTRVFVVPGFNNAVIVRHGNYLTVYSNLSEVYVKNGEKVTTRQRLGRVFTDAEDGNATILNLQLWKETTKLDPAPWLAR